MSKAVLISRLEQQLATLYQQQAYRKDKKIYARFPPTLFTENFETFEFYWKELNKTLEQIKSIPLEKEEELTFFCNKLISQYAVLQESLSYKGKKNNATFSQQKGPQKAQEAPAPYSAKEQEKRRVNTLPPRERLAKYYEYLNLFNIKVAELKDLIKTSQQELEKTRYQQRLLQTRQRRAKCLDAIEILEEFLSYQESQKP